MSSSEFTVRKLRQSPPWDEVVVGVGSMIIGVLCASIGETLWAAVLFTYGLGFASGYFNHGYGCYWVRFAPLVWWSNLRQASFAAAVLLIGAVAVRGDFPRMWVWVAFAAAVVLMQGASWYVQRMNHVIARLMKVGCTCERTYVNAEQYSDFHIPDAPEWESTLTKKEKQA